MLLKQLIEECVVAKSFVQWSEACRLLIGGTFKPSQISQLIAKFEAEVPGASALLVNRRGAYSEKAPVEAHRVWLQAHGYRDVPNVESRMSPVKVRRENKGSMPQLIEPEASITVKIQDLLKMLAEQGIQIAA